MDEEGERPKIHMSLMSFSLASGEELAPERTNGRKLNMFSKFQCTWVVDDYTVAVCVCVCAMEPLSVPLSVLGSAACILRAFLLRIREARSIIVSFRSHQCSHNARIPFNLFRLFAEWIFFCCKQFRIEAKAVVVVRQAKTIEWAAENLGMRIVYVVRHTENGWQCECTPNRTQFEGVYMCSSVVSIYSLQVELRFRETGDTRAIRRSCCGAHICR